MTLAGPVVKQHLVKEESNNVKIHIGSLSFSTDLEREGEEGRLCVDIFSWFRPDRFIFRTRTDTATALAGAIGGCSPGPKSAPVAAVNRIYRTSTEPYRFTSLLGGWEFGKI